MHEPEFRVPVAQVPDLSWSSIKAVVALAKITLPVLPLAIRNATDC
jgi:hypothetical protein